MQKLPAILLAAGLSSRMGAFKPLLPFPTPQGKPLLLHALGALHDSRAISDIIIVIGHRAVEIEAALRSAAPETPPCRTVFNPNYAAGEMLSSLRTGLSALPSPPDPRASPGFLLALADQPAVHPQTIARLVQAFFSPSMAQQSPPAAPSSATPVQSPPALLVIPLALGKRGHPVVLSTSLVPEIQSLSHGDSLKTVIHRHLAHATLLPVDDPSIHDDLDTPADFARAQTLASGKNKI
jgi:molybdenum cofactor cytidylyltransferase